MFLLIKIIIQQDDGDERRKRSQYRALKYVD